MQNTTIKIDGMTCMGCVNSLENVLKEISGVDKRRSIAGTSAGKHSV